MLGARGHTAQKKKTTHGRVTVTVEKGQNGPTLTVTDTGIGIPQGDVDRVFERFYRVDKSHSKEIGGTGLGLSIVKHGAAFHNAKVSLESVEGKGTTVRLAFPSSSLKYFPEKEGTSAPEVPSFFFYFQEYPGSSNRQNGWPSGSKNTVTSCKNCTGDRTAPQAKACSSA